jgi:sulfite exporter TauE/SafE
MVAQSFFPDASTDVFISPSNLGELYWNFGGLGAVLGMAVIGALLGWVGARFELSESVTLSRVLILAMTIQILVQGFEASIANQYSTWLRLMLGIGVLHVLFARMPVARESRDPTPEQAPALLPVAVPRFPNLMR